MNENQHTHLDFVLIANPIAGKGKAATVAETAYQQLTAAGRNGELKFTEKRGDANLLAQEVTETGGHLVIACGGDGTIHEIVNGIAEKPDMVLGVIPCGKGNDLPRALNIPMDPEKAVEVLLNGTTRQVDLGKIGERYFDTIVTCGYDAEVSHRVAEEGTPFSGTAAYVYKAITTLFSYKAPVARIEGDFGSYEGEILLTATGITQAYGGGMKIVPDAVSDDGLFDVCIIKPVSNFTILRMLITLFWGGHTSHPAVSIHRTKSLTIHTDPPTLLYADGEQVGHTPATIEMLERCLTVVAPPK